jgi:hypothetical protein
MLDMRLRIVYGQNGMRGAAEPRMAKTAEAMFDAQFHDSAAMTESAGQ